VAALAELREAGLEPRAVAALSGGEPAAAHAAGVLSLADATRVVLHAGRTLQAHATGLRLAIVWLGRAEALRSAALHGGGVAVAGDMLPDVVMVCGEAAPLASFLEALDARGVRQVPIPLPFGAHSPALRAGRRGFLAAVAGIVLREPRLPVLSATAGRWMRLAGEFGPAHWWRHLAAPVRFRAVVDRLLAGGFGPLVEVGPSSAFSSLVPRSGGACLRTEEALATFAPRSPGAPSA
jgi:acyl transferase domain-containing protein